MASALSEEQFWCVICLDIFKNPVSIPCGHNFCLACIKRFWDSRHKSECPLCKEAFKRRPELRINVGLKDITEQFKRSLKDKPAYKPAPAKRLIPRQLSRSEVNCDICRGNKLMAVKSCLVCRESYCEIHLTPHLKDQVLTKHGLTDPATFIASHLCRNHNELLEKFCKKDQTPVCMKCTQMDHKNHEIVPMEKESIRIKTQMMKTKAELQHMVQDRIRKCDEIKASVELSKEIEQKFEAAEKTAEKHLRELGEEIDELQMRCTELHHLEQSEDPLHLIQSFPFMGAPLSTKDLSEVRVHSDNYMGKARRTFSKLVDVCHKLEKKLSAEEMREANQFAVDVTMDPVTAAGWLILSPDGKKVSLGSQQWKPSPSDDVRRFDSCVSVLGKQKFTTGKSYWVVEVGEKTDWDLGVAKESIKRKGPITVRPDSGYWAICRRKGGSLSACAGPCVTLNLQETPQKVGIYLDYEEGLVSFYDAEAKTHIYTYSGCNFTEALYPYLNPCLHDNGKNTAPLIICPVNVGFTEEAAAF
ncbi:E3 ubiquitin-protein ligase TRIM21-like isoform X2 [Micropterus dolomieu]|uniref:E3 ubiquitin-protein ligase TRIM21-like isoform X2 n=1 Tax=Micropterus dolomieu TaxID=147949 RepID=UPI001E8DCE0E|nr:E3 ubiquitin-protein ligase TRIM21-like isoform X2 [Micropterus dolomieu]